MATHAQAEDRGSDMKACGMGRWRWGGRADLTHCQGGRGLGEGRDILASHAEAERGGAILQRCGERQLHGEVRMETWGGNDGLKEWHGDAVMAQTYINLVNLSYYALSHHLLPHILPCSHPCSH